MSSVAPPVRRARQRTAVLPTHGRQHNLSLVLQELYSEGAMSRADLARRVGLTKVTVSDLVAELLGAGRVVELGTSQKVRPGKPATLVDVNRSGLQAVGLDLAAHDALRAGVLDLDGNILVRAERLVGKASGDAVLSLVIDLVAEIVAAASAPLLGIGVGTPGIVGPGGVVEQAPNLGWRDIDLRAPLAERTGLPVFVVNDADAAAHAERTFGSGGDDMLLVKVGRGVGAGLIVGGSRVRGAHHAAGEIGHVVVGTDGGARCSCGKRGCLEVWAAAPRLQQALGKGAGRDVLRDAGERLGIALAPVVAALDLSEVVLSGPVDLLEGELREALDATLRARLLRRPHTGLTVRLATDPGDIVLRGAVALVLWDQLGVA